MDYVVPSHIYTCATAAGVVVLNARSGKYSIVPVDRAQTLEGVVQGWPALRLGEATSGNPVALSSLLNSLIHGGIVMPVTGPHLRRCERPAISLARKAILDALAAKHRPKIHSRDVGTFALSVLYAAFALKFRSFETLLNTLRQRKECRTRLAAGPSIEQIREYVRVFSWLRPFAYAESQACLFDSVALTDFLYRHGVLADLLIGVQIRPFVAHSWVQTQGFALNGLPEYLAAYTPILSV